jgi:phosphate starvation-inducible protein PhoH
MTQKRIPRKNGRTNLQLPMIEALTKPQDKMLAAEGDIVAHGSAGTGKTFLGLWMGLNDVLEEKKYTHVTIIRSAVETRKIGFLPGNEKEKTEVYEMPYKELCHEFFEDVNAYDKLKANGQIRFMTTSFIRGLNLRNSFVLVDEYQNMTFHELDSVITRMQGDSRVIWCGDTYQADLAEKSGIKEFNKILRQMDDNTFVDFTLDDVVRGPKVKNYLEQKYKILGG